MARAALWIVGLAWAMAAAGSEEAMESRETVAETGRFAFHSDLDFNLYDALLAAASARNEQRAEPMLRDAAACFDGLSTEQRSAWNAAVGYFAGAVASTWAFSRERYAFRAHFASLPIETGDDDRDVLALGLLFHRAAAPAYRACRWQEQDRANRDWIAALLPLLEAHEDALATTLERIYGDRWRQWPIPVDVVEIGGRYGADTIGGPRTHIRISSRDAGYRDLAALEMIFHEASHELVGPRYRVLREAAQATGTAVPGNDFWHALLFYTASEATRGRLAEVGVDYVPYVEVHDMLGRRWRPFGGPLRDHWLPWIRGQGDRESAAGALLEALADER